MTSTPTLTPSDTDDIRTDELAERLFAATIGTLELFSIHLGRRLGLYELLADGRARTPSELADDAGIAERYAREWLEQQAVAGLLDLVGPDDDANARRYQLSSAHARVLAYADDQAHVAPFGSIVAGIGQALPEVVEAYRTGVGVPYSEFGEDFRDGQGGINRPAFTSDLVEDWLPSLPDVHTRLQAGVRVADIGCGIGWSTQALARAYPNSLVTGIDTDAGSIADAWAALPADLPGQIDFVQAGAADADRHGPFDVVIVLETLHDIGDPVAGLAGIRSALADNGVVLIADERVADAFTAPGDEVERMMFGWSVLHCLPAAVVEGGPGAVGTALRAETLHRMAAEAGFSASETLPIDNDLFRFYRLTP
jgi:2-polyprenyl-3-methyl-5-hydroxy-6-metoxy-1,4-benzoquinol methylase